MDRLLAGNRLSCLLDGDFWPWLGVELFSFESACTIGSLIARTIECGARGFCCSRLVGVLRGSRVMFFHFMASLLYPLTLLIHSTPGFSRSSTAAKDHVLIDKLYICTYSINRYYSWAKTHLSLSPCNLITANGVLNRE